MAKGLEYYENFLRPTVSSQKPLVQIHSVNDEHSAIKEIHCASKFIEKL